MLADLSTIKQFIAVLDLPVYELMLIHPTETYQPRNGGDPMPVTKAALYDDRAKLADDAAGFNSEWNVYTRINPFTPNRPVSNNFDAAKVWESAEAKKTKKKSGSYIGNKDITRRKHVFVDIDVIRPDGRNSSDPQRDMVVAKAIEIEAFLVSRGFAHGLIGMSGNGGYVLLGCDLPVSDNKYVELLLRELSKKFSDDSMEVDTGVHDLPRLMRVLGTVNRKSPDVEGYRQGLSRIINLPEPFEATGLGAIQTITGLVETVEKKKSIAPLPGEHETRVEYCGRQLEAVGISYTPVERDDCTILRLECKCPFKPDDATSGGPALIVWKSDLNVVFSCKHNHCHDKKLADLEKKLGIILMPIARSILDPMTVAEKHRATFGPFIFFHGSLYQYQSDAWHEADKSDQDPFIIRIIDGIVTDLASRTRSRKAINLPVDVAGSAFRALQSLVAHPVPRDQFPPFFVGNHPWQALDVLPVQNGLLNLREFVTGGEHFIPPTANYFSLHRSRVTYDPSATAVRWFQFLESLEFEPSRRDLLQEMMGSSLWLGWQLQKLYLLVGATRGGKGTVAHMLRYLLGGPIACSSPSLPDFHLSENSFGLEASIGKRLAVIREMSFPSKGVDEIVSNLKAWLGGDLLQVNRKGIVAVATSFDTKLWAMTNHIVALPDSGEALQARIVPLVFQVSFVGREDTDLLRQLQDESAGILNWSLEGLKRLWASKGQFTSPQTSVSLLKALEVGGAPVDAYLRECCVLDPTKCVQKNSLHKHFCDWYGRENMGLTKFSNDLVSASAMRVSSGRVTGHGHMPSGYTLVPMDGDSTGRAHLFLGISPKGSQQ